MLRHVAHDIRVGRLLTMHAAWGKLDQGDFARKEGLDGKDSCRGRAAPGGRHRDSTVWRRNSGSRVGMGSTDTRAGRTWSMWRLRVHRMVWPTAMPASAMISGGGGHECLVGNAALEAWLRGALKVGALTVERAEKLSGRRHPESWGLDVR